MGRGVRRGSTDENKKIKAQLCDQICKNKQKPTAFFSVTKQKKYQSTQKLRLKNQLILLRLLKREWIIYIRKFPV